MVGFSVAPLTAQPPSVIAIGNGIVYPSPTAAPLADGVVIIQGATITAVGSRADVDIPDGAQVVDAAGGAIVAGFQNSHIHFTEPKWAGAARQPAAQLESQLESMLTQYGFTTVVDTGSSPDDTVAMRRRIEAGEIAGPRILTAGGAIYPAGGLPYYLRETLPPDLVGRLPQPRSAAEARAVVDRNLQAGADIIKLFTGSWVTNQRVQPMSTEVASAAAALAHAGKHLVFAHASSVEGLDVALAAGVDVVAHALDETKGLTAAHLRRMVDARMAMVPTLMLFGGSRETVEEVRDFRRAGGLLLFGTDAGYHQMYDPSREYDLLTQAGLAWRDILATLTTNPASRFGDRTHGQLARGMAADVVVLRGDPAKDVRAFAQVEKTIRAGRVIYGR